MSNQHSLSILLVDDDQDDQFFFREALTHIELDIRLSVANNHQEAAKFLSAYTADLIFLDINMPVINGKDSLKYIRENKKFNKVKVIMFTTSSSDKDIETCYELGANLYVTKPLSTSYYSSILQKIFQLSSQNLLHNLSKEQFVFKLNGYSSNY